MLIIFRWGARAVGSGQALNAGGPASLLLGFALIGVMIFCIVHALGELAVAYPVAGAFSVYSTRFIDPSWGFAMGWNYAILWLTTLPLETVAASLTIQYWSHGRINNDAWVSIFLFIVAAINLIGVRAYGEAEFVISLIKVIAIVGFILLGIILVCGGGPDGSYIGGYHYYDPGAFNNGFKGFCSVFVNAAFAFSGTELVGLAAAETANPRVALPKAVKQVFWRILIFYIISLLLVGLLVPYNDPRLLGGDSSADATASPFVIAVNNAGIAVLPSVINVVIMLSVLSVANSGVYACSRTLAAMADMGQAPRILGYVDRERRPLVAIIATLAFGLLAYLAGSSAQEDVFNWLLSLSSLCALFNWASIAMAQIRVRRAWKYNGLNLATAVSYLSPLGIWGSVFAIVLIFLVLVAQFWVGFAPVGYADMSASDRVQNFFLAYLALPLVALFYLAHKLWYRTTVVRLQDIDVFAGLSEPTAPEILAEERALQAQRPRWKKVIKMFC